MPIVDPTALFKPSILRDLDRQDNGGKNYWFVYYRDRGASTWVRNSAWTTHEEAEHQCQNPLNTRRGYLTTIVAVWVTWEREVETADAFN